MSYHKKLNGFNNGVDTTGGVGGHKAYISDDKPKCKYCGVIIDIKSYSHNFCSEDCKVNYSCQPT